MQDLTSRICRRIGDHVTEIDAVGGETGDAPAMARTVAVMSGAMVTGSADTPTGNPDRG